MQNIIDGPVPWNTIFSGGHGVGRMFVGRLSREDSDQHYQQLGEILKINSLPQVNFAQESVVFVYLGEGYKYEGWKLEQKPDAKGTITLKLNTSDQNDGGSNSWCLFVVPKDVFDFSKITLSGRNEWSYSRNRDNI